jgi:hypothetical protein
MGNSAHRYVLGISGTLSPYLHHKKGPSYANCIRVPGTISCSGRICHTAATCNVRISWRMVSSGMLRRVALVRTDVSEKLSSSFIRVTRIGALGTTLALTSNRCKLRQLLVKASVVPSSPILVTLMKEALSSSETSVLTRATRRNIPEDTILHSHRREDLKSYIRISCFIHRSFTLNQIKMAE